MLDKYLDYMVSKPSEIEEMIKTKPIAFIPFGALEWHGKHNILGVDSIKATEICRRAAKHNGRDFISLCELWSISYYEFSFYLPFF